MTDKPNRPAHPLLDEHVHEERSRRVLEAVAGDIPADDALDDDLHDGVPEYDDADPRGRQLAIVAHQLADDMEQLMRSGGDPSTFTAPRAPTQAIPTPVAELDTARIASMDRHQLDATVGKLRGGSPPRSMSDDQVRALLRADVRALRSLS